MRPNAGTKKGSVQEVQEVQEEEDGMTTTPTID
jgi:hypothetical protein